MKNSVEHWQLMIDHIDKSWRAKKRGAPYFWLARDFANLRRAARVYEPWGVMALWDCYIESGDTFAISQGYNVTEFVRQIPRLVDGNWKVLAAGYRDKLEPRDPQATAIVDSMIAKALLGKEIK
jgi:hypothetical protein